MTSRFVYYKTCGCVLSERAIREVVSVTCQKVPLVILLR